MDALFGFPPDREAADSNPAIQTNLFTLHLAVRRPLVSVDDERNQACLRVLPRSSRQIEGHDRWSSLEDTSGVRFLGRDRLHSEACTNKGLGVPLIAGTLGFNEQDERLLRH
jgi:hypothetical protein